MEEQICPYCGVGELETYYDDWTDSYYTEQVCQGCLAKDYYESLGENEGE
jgi:hypothetical protein